MANDPANGPLALSGIGAGLPQEAEYDAVYAAVTTTERGRWFLAEFANRNRHADTGSLVAALARIEAAVGAGARSSETVPTPDLAAAAEKIADVAFGLRERGADPALCNALDAAVREIGAACANEPERAHSATPAHADQTELVGEASSAATDQAGGRSDRNDGAAADVEFALQDPEQFAAAAAALAASLSSLGDQTTEEPQGAAPAEQQNSAAVIPPQDYSGIAAPPPEPAASAPRWYIEAPDFVFRPTQPAEDRPSVISSGEAREPHALLPGPRFLPNPEDDPAELFEAGPTFAVMPHSAAARGTVPTPSVSRAPTAVTEAVPLRIPVAPPVRAVARAVPINPLAALQALTEDELLALFG
ncbi:MAG TPA: hypothetical protein VHY10_19235 [Xanthobacteraceae bacterium]|jgi:hypothetical protein|nr:hypothetical protein [Xanthobacteraceae bacterium]